MDTTLAIQFVLNNANSIEQARLRFLRSGQPAEPSSVAEFCASQNQDGSWSPFWAANYSSSDATCFHLAQANQLGIDQHEQTLTKAFTFIANHQKQDGYWEEEPSVAEFAPPWAKPGELSARLYLTANCAYWLAISQLYPEHVNKAAHYLASYLNDRGQLASFLQAHWLSVGIWYQLGMLQVASQTMRYLETELGKFSANNLTWMITVLQSANVSVSEPLITEAIGKLAALQRVDGSWKSDDGEAYDVHTTLEALYSLKLCERM